MELKPIINLFNNPCEVPKQGSNLVNAFCWFVIEEEPQRED